MKVLVTPLNWGLGHATRDIPVITELLAAGHEVILAGDGASLSLLKQEFPQLKAFGLPSLNITYPENGSMLGHLLKQAGKLMRSISAEHKVIDGVVKREGVEVIISDNRFGCYSSTTRNIIMTHQLFIESSSLKRLINWVNHQFLKKFDEVWIVDQPGENNLGGKLSYRPGLPFTCQHLGILSRFSKKDVEVKSQILAVISGPEPQRSLLEKELLVKLVALDRPAIAVLGKPDDHSAPQTYGKLTVYPHLKGEQLEQLFCSADVVISRSGYTTLMDLAVLEKKALLIPTPGQSEQEYLAKRCKEKGWFEVQKQGEIDLSVLSGIKKPEGMPNQSLVDLQIARLLNTHR